MANAGCTPYHNPNLIATGVSVKTSACKLMRLIVTNMSASARYLKFYDKATAAVVGTDTPVLTIALPGSLAQQNIDLGQHVQEEGGVAFANGLSLAATTGAPDADVGVPSTGDVVVNLLMKP